MNTRYFSLSPRVKLQQFKGYLKGLQKTFGLRLGSRLLLKTLSRFAYLLRHPSVRLYQTPRARRDLVEAIVFNAALYHTLKQQISASEALAFVGQQIQHSGRELMEEAIPPLSDTAPMPGLIQVIHAAFGEAETSRIYTYQVREESTDSLAFDVTYCLYARLTRELGMPELGGCFCDVDQPFFADFDVRVGFERSQTLAKDGKPCDFRFFQK